MKCPNCKQEIDPKAVVCVHCGSQFGFPSQVPEDKPSFLLALLSFFIPFLGFILHLLHRGDRDKTAKSALRGAIAGTVTIILSVIIIAVIVCMGIIYYL